MIIRAAFILLLMFLFAGMKLKANYLTMTEGKRVQTIWREKGNEFGEDVLRKHYIQQKH